MLLKGQCRGILSWPKPDAATTHSKQLFYQPVDAGTDSITVASRFGMIAVSHTTMHASPQTVY